MIESYPACFLGYSVGTHIQSIPQDITVACLALLYALLVSSSFDFAMGQLLVLWGTVLLFFFDFEWMYIKL